ncbi:hypothetical protein LEP1GSC185_1096 [Leptospira licerasiae serovar Varillal str. VAR 010]|uniref:Uncharacterized protein n=1 Tax=Leptospira licerasiae str. MMD4847 TaxID=1049971 RepID=A0ABN0H9L7_9LEPT|nr:hypothetical protein LEP1GSC185_1096 [Leptospira licerasiae serovar Varillal str. VAR 010]EJZ42396.1 hypothetical protein LEP1GSC178_3447 [Leptospira licerasiae str. MMD4847]
MNIFYPFSRDRFSIWTEIFFQKPGSDEVGFLIYVRRN